MTHLSIRDLQKISSETIGTLAGPTPVKSGERTVGLLIPLKAADPERLAAVLARAEAFARGRDDAADDPALARFGEVHPVDWSIEAVRSLMKEGVIATDVQEFSLDQISEAARQAEAVGRGKKVLLRISH